MNSELIWKQSKRFLRKILNAEIYERWINGIVPISISDDSVEMGVPDEFFADWLHTHFEDLILDALKKVAGNDFTISYKTGFFPEERTAKPKKKRLPQENTSDNAVKFSPAPNCHSRHTFSNFVVGPENQFAHAAAMGIVGTSNISANPLFIYGGTGLGKTHLLQAVAHEATQSYPDSIVEYISCEDFLNLYVDSLRMNRHSDFRNRFRKADFLLIDDIHFLAKKTQLQEEFFNTFNRLHNEDKKIIMTSDKRPSEINGLETRLVSRFVSGLTVDIQPLGVETRLAILRKKQEEHLIKFDNEILSFIANNIVSNVRKLEGALTRLLTYSSLTGKRITVELAEQILSPLLEEETVSRLSVDMIQKKVAEYFDLRVSDLTGNKRPKNIAIPRMIAMYLCRKMTSKSLPEIGDSFARNHATVIHAVNRIKEDRAANESLNRSLALLERQLQQQG